MAIRSKITQIRDDAELAKLGYKPNSIEFKTLIQEMIRLDIPILEIGSSSIGKSFSLREFMAVCGIRGQFLFVGTEKSEFIEGVPNLKAVSEERAKFTYLQPYWFPDKTEIKNRLINGARMLIESQDEEIKKMWIAATTNYSALETLKSELLKKTRSSEQLKEALQNKMQLSQYIYEDSLLYISTIQGYGNFWLVLDEIDKVEKQDKDKYAPLLHIVRERELKGWKLSGLRDWKEYDIKYVQTIDQRIIRLNAALADPNVDVTDTRVIAIANDLKELEKSSPALYRRFVKIIVNSSLYDEKTPKLPSGQATGVGYDWSKSYDVKKNDIHSCIVKHTINRQEGAGRSVKVSISEDMANIDVNLTGKPLNEMNLQWTLGFLPEMLFPGVDTRTQAKDIGVPNLLIENFNDTEDPFKTLLYKIIQDNFAMSYWIPMLECIYDQISPKASDKSKDSNVMHMVNQLYQKGGITTNTLEDPDGIRIDEMLGEYQQALVNMESEFSRNVELQRKMAQGLVTEDDAKITNVQNAVYNVAIDTIQIGNKLILNSLNKGKISKTTEMLMSAVPFLQTRMICSSPNIAHKVAEDLMERVNDAIVDLIKRLNDGQELTAENAKELTENVFNKIEPYSFFEMKYGAGIEPADIEEMESGMAGPTKRNNREELLQRVISRRPVLEDRRIQNILVADDDLRTKYHMSISPSYMIIKEIYGNLAGIFGILMETNDQNQMSAKFKHDLSGYCALFPGKMMNLALTVKQKFGPNPDGTFQSNPFIDYIEGECEKAFGTTQHEIDKVNS